MRVLYLTHRLPYAPNRGDRIRAYHTIRTLAARMEIEVVSLVHDRFELAQVDRLRDMGIRVNTFHAPRLRNLATAAMRLPGRTPLTHMLLDSPDITSSLQRIVHDRAPDVVLAYCSGMARFALQRPLSGFPLVVDLVDVDSEKWAALSQSSRWPMRWIYRREARCLARFERRMTEVAAATLVVNDRERDALRLIAPGAKVAVFPNGIDLRPLTPPGAPDDHSRVVFCGVMSYTPNVDGMLWFCHNVWPVIRRRRPDAELLVVGSDPAPAVLRLHSPENGVEVTGTVDDVRPHLWRSAVAIAPLLTARGIQNKVLEAVGAGLPAVVSSQVFEGLPPAVRPACRVAVSTELFAEEVLSLLALSPSNRRQVADRAELSDLGWESQLRPLHRLLTDSGGRQAIAV